MAGTLTRRALGPAVAAVPNVADVPNRLFEATIQVVAE